MVLSLFARLCILGILSVALVSVGVVMAARPFRSFPPKSSIPKVSSQPKTTHSFVGINATNPLISAPNTPASFARRCAEARQDPVLDSYVELRSATDACPSPSKPPPTQIPYPDLTACPFLQQTNNQPALDSERQVPKRNRVGSTCPRINIWWSDQCGIASL